MKNNRPLPAVLSYLACAFLAVGCATVSDTKLSESTAPATLRTSNSPAVTGEYTVVVDSSVIRSMDPDALYDAAVEKAHKKCPVFDITSQRSGSGIIQNGVTDRNARWLELRIRCLKVAKEKIKVLGAAVVERESKILADASAFDIHAETFPGNYDLVFDTVVRILKDQGDPIYRTDRDKGVIVTGRARHGAVGFPRYEQYVVAVDEATETTATVTFRLLIHIPDLANRDGSIVPSINRPVPLQVAQRQFVYQRAAAFVDSIRASLKRK